MARARANFNAKTNNIEYSMLFVFQVELSRKNCLLFL